MSCVPQSNICLAELRLRHILVQNDTIESGIYMAFPRPHLALKMVDFSWRILPINMSTFLRAKCSFKGRFKFFYLLIDAKITLLTPIIVSQLSGN